MRGGRGVVIGMLGVVCGLALVSLAVRAEQAPRATARGSGMRAYADPRTGALLPGPPPGSPPRHTAAFSRSSVGLVETRAPGGGVMVDLQGRFQSPLVATVGPDGRVRLHHRHAE